MTEKLQYTASASHHTMRASRVLSTIRAGGVARVLKLNTRDPKVAEIFAAAGPDAIWVCQEHCSGTMADIEQQIRAAKVHNVDTIVRVARGGYPNYARPLEADATGLMVPHVMGAKDAADIVAMTKFAPLGRRAVDGGNEDGGFTRVSFPDYLQLANSERFVCHQIEDPESLDSLEEMAAMEGVDCLFFGPGDFSVRLGIPGQIQHPEIVAVRKRVAEVARKYGKIAGTVAGTANLPDYIDMGYNLISVGADVVALAQYADQMMEAFDKV